MNILLVDDDKFILEGLSRGIEWERLPFTSRYEAKNAVQARAIIEKIDIHVLLCDIEMPGKNGLDLLAWVRENNYPMEVVFLTSHPDFDYARRALSLGSFEYILKPIEYEKLTDVLDRAARKVDENLIRNQYLAFINTDQEIMRERKTSFLRKMITGYLSLTDTDILSDIEKGRLNYTLTDQFVLYVINVRHADELNWRDDGQIYYALQASISEALERFRKDKGRIIPEAIWKENISHWVVAMKVEDSPDNLWYALGKTLTDVRKSFKWRRVDFSAYVSELAPLSGLHRQWVTIRKMIFDNIAFRDGVFFVNNFVDVLDEEEAVPFDRARIEKAFNMDSEAEVLRLVDAFILDLGRRPDLNSRLISRTVFDWQQAVFHYLEERQIVAETLYANDEYISLFQRINVSLEDYRLFLRYITEAAFDNTRKLELDADNTIHVLKHYIEENLSEDLSRNALANVVFLNGDYLATFFKRKTGESLKKYVLDKRMQKARELLQTSEEPIYAIALKVGYPSASYFSRQFKNYFGQEPNDFRKKPE
ncbi:MAG: response regulator [Lachnospiraceae bacterium]|nr:response regulator [Lachnospiraceae bacterium]